MTGNASNAGLGNGDEAGRPFFAPSNETSTHARLRLNGAPRSYKPDFTAPITLRYDPHDPEELKKVAVKEKVFDLRSIVSGVLLFMLLFIAALFIRFSVDPEILKRLETFEFTTEQPKEDEVKIKEPQRPIFEEKAPDNPDQKDEVRERLNIQMTPVQQDVTQVHEVVKTNTIEIATQIDPAATDMDFETPEDDVAEPSESIAFQHTSIAVVSKPPADMFIYKEPDPNHRPRFDIMPRALKPGAAAAIKPRQWGDLDAPTLGETGPMSINLVGDGQFMGRKVGRRDIQERSAVDAALYWLATHQEADGGWDQHRWDPENVGPEAARGNSNGQYSTGVSGLAVIAFMAGGHTIRKGEYRAHVLRALNYLIQKQDVNSGALSKDMYEHAIGTIALCEAVGRAPLEHMKQAARRAVDFCAQSVNADGGWRYAPKSPASDTSVTAWFIQALKTAKLANIGFESRVLSDALTYLDRVTDKGGSAVSSGAVAYMYTEGMNYSPDSHSKGPAMTAAGMVIRQFTGVGVKSDLLVKGAEIIKKSPPDWNKKDFYYWYYATYAMHNMGGEYRVWWNRSMRDVLLQNQSKIGHQKGSWNPEKDSHNPGRVYATSMGALCLEVYYRYDGALQTIGTAPDLGDLFFNK